MVSQLYSFRNFDSTTGARQGVIRRAGSDCNCSASGGKRRARTIVREFDGGSWCVVGVVVSSRWAEEGVRFDLRIAFSPAARGQCTGHHPAVSERATGHWQPRARSFCRRTFLPPEARPPQRRLDPATPPASLPVAHETLPARTFSTSTHTMAFTPRGGRGGGRGGPPRGGARGGGRGILHPLFPAPSVARPSRGICCVFQKIHQRFLAVRIFYRRIEHRSLEHLANIYLH